MAKRIGSRTFFPIRVDIPSLSGGVGRSTPAKRIPTESENIDNMLVTLEHSGEKRRGVELLNWNATNKLIGRLDSISEAQDSTGNPTRDLWFHWFLVSSTAKYLIIIDYKATVASGRQLLWVYKVDENGELTEELSYSLGSEVGTDDASMRDYITEGNDTHSAKDALRAVSIGSSLLILNTTVKAGFTSVETDDPNDEAGLLRNMDGTVGGGTDHKGSELNYLTSTTVDEENDAEIWTGYTQYIAGDHAYDPIDNKNPKDEHSAYTTGEPKPEYLDVQSHDHLRSGIWRVIDDAADIVGPDGSGFTPRRPSAGIASLYLNDTTPLSGNLRSSHYNKGSWSGGSTSSKATQLDFN